MQRTRRAGAGVSSPRKHEHCSATPARQPHRAAPGGAARLSTRSIRAASSTPTATAIGDLPGIIERLDYVATLGVEAIWVSPFFKSPMADFGYDIADYRAVDPIFGTLADFDRLVAQAHTPRPQGDHRPGAEPHLRSARLVRTRAGRAATTPRPTGTCGPTRAPTARRLTTGCRSSAASPGPWEPRRGAVLPAQFPQRPAGPEFPQSRRAARGARQHALLAGSRRRRPAARRHQLLLPRRPAARQPAAAAGTRARRRGFNADNPYGYQWHRYNNTQPEMLPFLEEHPRAARRISRTWWRWARSPPTTPPRPWPNTRSPAGCTWPTASSC